MNTLQDQGQVIRGIERSDINRCFDYIECSATILPQTSHRHYTNTATVFLIRLTNYFRSRHNIDIAEEIAAGQNTQYQAKH